MIAESVKIQAIIYTNEKCEEARINRGRKDMAGTGIINMFAYWGNYDVTFDLGLDKLGVNLSKLYCPVEPK